MIRFCASCVVASALLMVIGVAQAAPPTPLSFALEGQKIRYGVALALNNDELRVEDPLNDHVEQSATYKHKSTAKAFFLSLAVPGLGQFYNGSKLKSVGFLGAEVTSWVLYNKWHSQADDMTAEFEQFNRDHWNQVDYEKFLDLTYGESDDELLTNRELSHHLPDTRTQQYYEMTGKYDQFAWGWDDANIDEKYLDDYSENDPPPYVNVDENIPHSDRRLIYEQQRKDTDGRYKRARRMIFVSMANRLISAFEALIAAKRNNKQIENQGGSTLAGVSMKASLKSYYAGQDTPFVTLTVKF